MASDGIAVVSLFRVLQVRALGVKRAVFSRGGQNVLWGMVSPAEDRMERSARGYPDAQTSGDRSRGLGAG